MNKRKLRCAAALLVGLGVLGTLTGCGQEKKVHLNPANPVRIQVLTYYNGAVQMAFDNLVDEFNDTVGSEQGIYVESVSTGDLNTMNEAIQREMAKNADERELPNIFCSYSAEALEYLKSDVLVDLSQYFTEEELAEYVDAYIEEGRIGQEGELYSIPVAKSTEIMTVNATDWGIFAQATGVDISALDTWEGLLQTARKYYEWTDASTEEANDGKALFGRDALANYMVCGIQQLGGEIFQIEDYQATLVMDEAVMRKLWDNFYVPYVKGYYAQYGKYSSDDMKTGGILTMVSSSAGAAFLPSEVTIDDEESYSIELELRQVPGFEGTQPVAIQQGAGMVVSKSDELQQMASCIFLKWFTDSKVNTRFAIASSYLPVKKEANDLAYVEKIAEEENVEWNDTMKAALDVAFEAVQNGELCTTPLFDGSYQCRNILQSYILDKAVEARKEVLAQTEAGQDMSEAVEDHCSQTAFDTWMSQLQSELENILE